MISGTGGAHLPTGSRHRHMVRESSPSSWPRHASATSSSATPEGTASPACNTNNLVAVRFLDKIPVRVLWIQRRPILSLEEAMRQGNEGPGRTVGADKRRC